LIFAKSNSLILPSPATPKKLYSKLSELTNTSAYSPAPPTSSIKISFCCGASIM
jgi:hypothetical protein